MKLSKMAVWPSSNNPKSIYKGGVEWNDMAMMGLSVPQSSVGGLDLMQNCDLPPPMKIFTGSDKNMKIYRTMGGPEEQIDEEEELSLYRNRGGDNYKDKLELLKALRLSQTRAREAENRASILAKEKDCLENALLEEAKQLFAYRQLVRLLELQVSYLNSKWLQGEKQDIFVGSGHDCDSSMFAKEGDEEDDRGSLTRVMALALCLGIAGVGFVYGCRYLS